MSSGRLVKQHRNVGNHAATSDTWRREDELIVRNPKHVNRRTAYIHTQR